jgi:hypothetical protein
MAYTVPTAADLKTRYPAFAAVADATVNAMIVEANRSVDETWTEGDYAPAIMALAAHIMATEGLGTDPDSQSNTGQMSNFQMIKSGQLTLQRKQSATGTADWYASTRYGNRYLELLGRNKPGVAVVWRLENLDDRYYGVPFNGGFGS